MRVLGNGLTIGDQKADRRSPIDPSEGPNDQLSDPLVPSG
jgi:hypothetical protein